MSRVRIASGDRSVTTSAISSARSSWLSGGQKSAIGRPIMSSRPVNVPTRCTARSLTSTMRERPSTSVPQFAWRSSPAEGPAPMNARASAVSSSQWGDPRMQRIDLQDDRRCQGRRPKEASRTSQPPGESRFVDVAAQSRPQVTEQRIVVHRLGQIGAGAALQRPRPPRRIRGGGDHDHGNGRAEGPQPALQIDPVHPRHPDVGDEAVEPSGREIRRGRPRRRRRPRSRSPSPERARTVRRARLRHHQRSR